MRFGWASYLCGLRRSHQTPNFSARPNPSNQAYQFRETYWLYVVSDSLLPGAEVVRMQDPATRLERAAKEVVKKRVFVVPAHAIDSAGPAGG